MAVSMIGPKFYAWDRNGKPLAFGKLYTYQARTNTPKATYQSEDQVVENTNPVILNGEGYANVYLDGSYKMVLKDSNDNEIWSSDPVSSNQATEWTNCVSVSYLSPSSFSIVGNYTNSYEAGRNARIDNNAAEYSYATIESSIFSGGNTIVTLMAPVVTTGVVGACVSILGPNSTNILGGGKYKALFSNTEDLKNGKPVGGEAGEFSFADGQTVSVQGYYSPGDGGESEYQISTNSDVDSYSSFSLGGGLYAHPVINGGVIKSTQFGVMPDGVTNWEATHGARMLALYAALNRGTEVRFIRVGDNTLYFTGMNIYNYYAQNWTMSFDDGVEFGNILHIISSGTAIFDKVVATIPNGTNPTITFASAHGMATQRYCTFEGTGTSLDGGSYLVTPTGVDTATVTATVTGTNTGTGTASDTPIKNVTLKGTYTTYDRWGLINVDGLRADRIVCKSDSSKHTTGRLGGGVHVFTKCKNFNVDEVIVEDTATQAQSANLHAAFACDGIGLENINIKKVWIKDTGVNGAIIQGEGYHIGQLVVDRYGRGVMSSVIPFVGASDLHGQSSYTLAHGVWISRATGRIDHIVVNQKDGFGGRAYAQKDVCFDRDFLLWDSPSQGSFVDVKTGFSVGHIECKNPKYVAVDLGSYQGWCSPHIDKITLGVIPDENGALQSDSLKLERGLVNVGYTRATIGTIRAQNIKEAALVLHNALYSLGITPAMGREPSFNAEMIDCEDHAASIVTLNCPHSIGSITTDKVTIKDSYYLEPSILVGTRAVGSNIGRITGRLEAGQANKCLLEYGAQSSTIGVIEAYNFVANKTTNDAVLHFKNTKYSTVGNIRVNASSLSATAAGIKYEGTYNFKTDNAIVDKMAQGVVDGGGNGRLICVGCVSLANTVATDLPVSSLVVNEGNYQWTV